MATFQVSGEYLGELRTILADGADEHDQGSAVDLPGRARHVAAALQTILDHPGEIVTEDTE